MTSTLALIIIVCVGFAAADEAAGGPRCPVIVPEPGQIFVCRLNNVRVDCTAPMAADTKVSVTCEPNYNVSVGTGQRHVTRCRPQGSWSQSLATCVAESYNEPHVGRPLLAGGNVTLPSAVPWNVAIYKVNGNRYTHQCGGTLITPSLVVTAAHCFWDLVTKAKVPDANQYKVAAGKIYRDWGLDEKNLFVQRLDIEDVILDNIFEGWARQTLRYDFALVKLATNVTMSKYVQLARVDLTPGTPANGSVGVIAGWGFDESGSFSSELRSVELPYVDFDSCFKSLGEDKFKRLLTNDKFCAGFIGRNIGVCPGDSGGGFVEVNKETNVATLRGIVSLDFRPANTLRDACYAQNYAGFTNVGEARFIALINRHRTEGPPAPCPAVVNTSSIVVEQCLHDYLQVDCSLPMSPGTVTVLRCLDGYKLSDGRATTHVTCLKTGSWSRRTSSCEQEIRCPALRSTSGQQMTCLLDDEVVDCSVRASVGTVASLTCERDYVFNIQAGRKRATTCLASGEWSSTLASCLSQPAGECGRQSVSSTLVVKGETVVAGQLPWYVHIDGVPYSPPGTLISATHVVTNAYYNCEGNSNTPLPASEFTLTAGQLIRDSTPAEEPLQKTRGVRSILIHPQFTGGEGAAHNIALLVADASFVITPAVNVACVDWSGLFPAPTASDVIIVAAYKRGTSNTAHMLTVAQLYSPVAPQQCRERAGPVTRSWITKDRFCAAATNNVTCYDHDGGGLMVERDTGGARRFYLTGVWSVELAWKSSDYCYYHRLIGFTNVTQHIGWLQQHVSPPT